jgi:glutathione S-transferase
MPPLNLFLTPGACSLAPHILLRESCHPFSLTKVDFAEHSGFPPALLHINPKGRVPVLQINDTEILTENPAIMTAIAQMSGRSELLGRTDLERFRCAEWMNWLSGTLHGQGYGGLFRPSRYIDDASQFEAVRARSRQTIKECYEKIDTDLAGREFALGESFTAIDAYLFVFYRWGNGNGFSMVEKYREYTRWAVRMSERQSVKDAVAEEGIEMLDDKKAL